MVPAGAAVLTGVSLHGADASETQVLGQTGSSVPSSPRHPQPVAVVDGKELYVVSAAVVSRHGARAPIHSHASVDFSAGFPAKAVPPPQTPQLQLLHVSVSVEAHQC